MRPVTLDETFDRPQARRHVAGSGQHRRHRPLDVDRQRLSHSRGPHNREPGLFPPAQVRNAPAAQDGEGRHRPDDSNEPGPPAPRSVDPQLVE